jgi:hypothetical protein
MFQQNKYTQLYNKIIEKSRVNTKHPGYEYHHIIPDCLGGTRSKDNMVWLTSREHFICHWLLTKMTSGIDYTKMLFALNGMKRISKNQQRYSSKITSRVYARVKLELATQLSLERKGKSYEELYGVEKAAEMRLKKALPRGKQTPETIAKRVAKTTGLKRTLEQKENMGNAQRAKKERSPEEKLAYAKKMSESKKGKSLGPKSEEHRAKLSAALLGKKTGPRSEETKQKMRKPKSEEHKRAMSESRKAMFAELKALRNLTS